jgi:hypothetical protein
VTEEDYELFARAERKLAELQIEQEQRRNLKDWKRKILPFPSAEMLEKLDSGEVSAGVSNMMKQHLVKTAKEACTHKSKSGLEADDDILQALLQAQKRSDLFKPNWCMEMQDLAQVARACGSCTQGAAEVGRGN